MVLCDLPYGVTDCRWDRKIDIRRLWEQWRRVAAPGAAVVLFAQGKFIAELMNASPYGWFRYDLVWDKRGASGFLNAKRVPMRAHESVLVFGQRLTYRPQGLRRVNRPVRAKTGTTVYGAHGNVSRQTHTGYPTSILRFAREQSAGACAKPVALLEWLIRSYTAEGAVVLDSAMGLGSAGVAAVRSGREFVGMEIDPERFKQAKARIEGAVA